MIQAKLTVGAVGDYYEREADRVANQVVDMPAPSGGQALAVDGAGGLQRQAEEDEELQMEPLATTITPLVQRQAEEDEELQMKPVPVGQVRLQRQMEEEEDLQMKPVSAGPAQVQRQMEEEEDLQMKPALAAQAPVQRQLEEEEELQMKPDAGTYGIQRQMEEEEELQMKPDAGIYGIQRQGDEEEELQMASGMTNQDGSFQASRGLEGRLAAEAGQFSPLAFHAGDVF